MYIKGNHARIKIIMKSFSVKGKVWKYHGASGWHFVYIDKKISEKLKAEKNTKKVGWSLLKIKAKIGKTEWNTALFPTKEGPYLIAIKASVRKKEGILEDDTVRITCTLI